MNRFNAPSRSDGPMIKVYFDLRDHTESLWAAPIGSNKYRLRNIPFEVYGVSYDDVIVGKPNADGHIVFDGVDQQGGHSTYRVILNEGTTDDQFASAWEQLESLGASYERNTDRLIAVDIPPETDIYAAYAALESGEENNIWDFEEGHCGHLVKTS